MGEGTTSTAVSTGFDAIMDSMPTLTNLMEHIWTLMTSNPLLTLFLATSLLTVGVSVFRLIRPCLINGNMPKDEKFFRQSRRETAGILCVFQG